jgi:hypothetical protein
MSRSRLASPVEAAESKEEVMNAHVFSPTAGNQSSNGPVDPVVTLALEAARLDQRYFEIDALGGGQSQMEKAYMDDESEELWDRVEQIRGSITSLEAESLEGALAQTIIAGWLLHQIEDYNEEGDQKEESKRLKSLCRRQERCLYSIMNVLSKMPLSVSPETLGSDLLMSVRQDPWKCFEDRLASCHHIIEEAQSPA